MASLTRTETLSLSALSALALALLVAAIRASAPLHSSLALSVFAFAATFALIRWLGDVFAARGLRGRDQAKRGRVELPETLGAVAAVVYILALIAFIPLPFVRDFVAATSGGGNRDVVEEVQMVETGRLLHKFPHSKLALYLAALLSLQSVTLLGIGDDLFDIRWRHKFFIPAVAAVPLLLVYFVDFGVTQVVVPRPLRPYLGGAALVDLGTAYYGYMAAVAVFCPNAINILAGINGLEVGQALVVALLLLANDALYLVPAFRDGAVPLHPAADAHLFSAYLLLPFVGVSAALLWHNWYPARVFVGDTYCYFAGMVVACAGILGHFSKTLLLLLLPQIANFLYSAPQLFGVVPCPRHRLPKFNSRTGLLEPSAVQWPYPPAPWLAVVIRLLHRLRLMEIRQTSSKGLILETSNLTLLNLWLLWFGPMREDRLALSIVGLQVFCGLIGLFVRHALALWLFSEDNRSFTLTV